MMMRYGEEVIYRGAFRRDKIRRRARAIRAKFSLLSIMRCESRRDQCAEFVVSESCAARRTQSATVNPWLLPQIKIRLC
jgi:hypothetical protein